jgi:hypothetical protein
MAYLAQDEDAQKRIKSFRLTTADGRASQRDDLHRNTTLKKKKEELVLSKSEASFTINSVVGQVVPVNGEYGSPPSTHTRHSFWSEVARLVVRQQHFTSLSRTLMS